MCWWSLWSRINPIKSEENNPSETGKLVSLWSFSLKSSTPCLPSRTRCSSSSISTPRSSLQGQWSTLGWSILPEGAASSTYFKLWGTQTWSSWWWRAWRGRSGSTWRTGISRTETSSCSWSGSAEFRAGLVSVLWRILPSRIFPTSSSKLAD